MTTTTSFAKNGISEITYAVYLDALLKGDTRSAEQVIRDEIDRGAGLKAVYLDLIQKAMHEVGAMWEQNRLSVATEHLTSAVTELLLARIYPDLFASSHKDLRAVITCVPGEMHRIAPRIVADFFELHGWHGFFLGANTPTRDLLSFIGERDADVVGLSMSLFSSLPKLEETVAAVASDFPDVRIFLGGQGLGRDASAISARESLLERYPRASYFASLNELEEYLCHD